MNERNPQGERDEEAESGSHFYRYLLELLSCSRSKSILQKLEGCRSEAVTAPAAGYKSNSVRGLWRWRSRMIVGI